MLFLDILGGFFRGIFGRKAPALPAPRTTAARPMSYTDLGWLWRGAGSDGGKWPAGLSRSGMAPILHHFLLTLNARSAYHTSLQARAIIERHTDTVVATGLKLSAMPDYDVIGISAEDADDWAADVEARFDCWAKSRKATIKENMNFYQAQRLAGISQQRDGEYFVRLTYSARTDLLNPLQLQFIDPNQIRGLGITSSYGLNDLHKDGIKRDPNGKEIGYLVYLRQPDNTLKPVEIPAYGPRSKRTMMLHGYMPEYAGQGRGYSRLSHALQEFENITDYSVSEVKKAIAQSCINMYVKPNKDNVSSNPFEAMSHAQPVGPAQLSPQAQELAEDAGIDPGDLLNYIKIPEATVAIPGSVGVFNLNEGEDLRPFESTSPVGSFEGFINTLAGHLSASLSIPLEVVLMKFGQNFSASRAALVLFWRVAQIWRDEMASDFLNVIYENWLAGEIAAGRIQAPGWSDPRMREAWLKNTWIGVPMPNIDPQKTAKADQIYASMGATDLDRVARELNGSSGKANRAKLRRQLSELPPMPWDSKGNPDGGSTEAEGEKEGE